MKEYSCPELKVVEVFVSDIVRTSTVIELPSQRNDDEVRAIPL